MEQQQGHSEKEVFWKGADMWVLLCMDVVREVFLSAPETSRHCPFNPVQFIKLYLNCPIFCTSHQYSLVESGGGILLNNISQSKVPAKVPLYSASLLQSVIEMAAEQHVLHP